MTARLAAPRLSRSVAFESPIENPSGEKVKLWLEPESETPLAPGPASVHSGVSTPRRRMVRATGSTDRMTT